MFLPIQDQTDFSVRPYRLSYGEQSKSIHRSLSGYLARPGQAGPGRAEPGRAVGGRAGGRVARLPRPGQTGSDEQRNTASKHRPPIMCNTRVRRLREVLSSARPAVKSVHKPLAGRPAGLCSRAEAALACRAPYRVGRAAAGAAGS